MSEYANIIVLVEGQTEEKFVKEVLAPYLAEKNIFMTPIVLSKPGVKGGDVKFSRAKKDIGLHIKQRNDVWITLLIDFYGIKEWPGLEEASSKSLHTDKSNSINRATMDELNKLYSEYRIEERFIPYISMYEFEALLFSDAKILSEKMNVDIFEILKIINQCGEPENINNNPNTAPSKRLEKLSDRFKKTTTGIDIAKSIGIPKMREACTLFNEWLNRLESLTQ